MAKFESEWEGKGRHGKDLKSDAQLMKVSTHVAKVFRVSLMQMEIGEEVWMKDAGQIVSDTFAGIMPNTVRRYRQMMAIDFGLIYTRKEEGGRSWLMGLTDRGVDFVQWLLKDKDGQQWGVKDKFDISAEEKKRYEKAFILGNALIESQEESEGGSGGLVTIEGEAVRWKLPAWGLVLDSRVPRGVWAKIMARVHERGMRTVFVPDGYEVVVLEMAENKEGGKPKKKAHRVVRWSEFPVVDKQLIIDAVEDGKIPGAGDEGERDDELG